MATQPCQPMTDPSPTTQQELIEVFSSELPSQCNIYISGKQSATRRRRAPPPHHRHPKGGKKASPPLPLLRFATDRHSLTLLQGDCAEKGSVSNRERGGDEYSLSVARLPSSSSSSSSGTDGKKSKKSSTKKSTGTTKNDHEENCDVCQAHSSVFWECPLRVYQVNFDDINCGKIIALSKRRIHFKFGYLHGSEHEVIVTWSFSSGKQTIELDGKEIFCNDEYSLTMD